MNKLLFTLSIILTISCANKSQTNDCLNTTINKNFNKNDYSLDSAYIKQRNYFLKITVNSTYYNPITERELCFYLLSNIEECNIKNIDSVFYKYEYTLREEKNITLKYSFTKLMDNIKMRDSVNAPLFYLFRNNLIMNEDYRGLVSAYSYFLGIVKYGNRNELWNEDFFKFLMDLNNEVQHQTNNSKDILEKLIQFIKNEEMDNSKKLKALNYLTFIKNKIDNNKK